MTRRPQNEAQESAQILIGIYEDWLSRMGVGVRKYDPNPPRVPTGNPDGGQWTSDGGSPTSDRGLVYSTDRRIALSIEEKCETQYEKDLDECRLVGSPACYAQAMLRYSNCLRGLPIPPLNY